MIFFFSIFLYNDIAVIDIDIFVSIDVFLRLIYNLLASLFCFSESVVVEVLFNFLQIFFLTIKFSVILDIKHFFFNIEEVVFSL